MTPLKSVIKKWGILINYSKVTRNKIKDNYNNDKVFSSE